MYTKLVYGIGRESNRMDNPTEITRADVDVVVRTLRGNNALKLAQVKPLVIDLELLAA